MQPPENPYESPQEVDFAKPPSERKGLKELKAPATWLLVLGGSSFLFRLLFFVLVVWAKRTKQGVVAADLNDDFDNYGLIYIASFLCVAATTYGAIQMLRGRDYPFCVVGAAAACIPLLGPCYGFSIPIGFWALVILLRKETRAAFSELR